MTFFLFQSRRHVVQVEWSICWPCHYPNVSYSLFHSINRHEKNQRLDLGVSSRLLIPFDLQYLSRCYCCFFRHFVFVFLSQNWRGFVDSSNSSTTCTLNTLRRKAESRAGNAPKRNQSDGPITVRHGTRNGLDWGDPTFSSSSSFCSTVRREILFGY